MKDLPSLQVDTTFRRLTVLLVGGMTAFLLLLSAWRVWHAFGGYGARYSADLAPVWAVLGAFGMRDLLARRPWRFAFAALLAASIAFQALGVYVDVYPWNRAMYEKHSPDALEFSKAAWDTENPQICYQARRLFGRDEDED